MNFAHIVGGHHFDNQLQAMGHFLMSWLPLVVALGLGLTMLVWLVKRPRITTVKEEIHKR